MPNQSISIAAIIDDLCSAVDQVCDEAGLEWAAGVHIVPLSPERAAAVLRAAI